ASGVERADGRGASDPQSELRQRYSDRPEPERDLVARVAERFRQTAVATDRAILVAEMAQLSPLQRRLAARYPSALPLILADPPGVTDLLETFQGDETAMGEALVVLSMISLE